MAVVDEEQPLHAAVMVVRAREEVADYNPYVEHRRYSTSDYSALH